MTTLYLDLETYSETPIKNGTYRHAQDAEILLFAYAIDDKPAQVLDLTGQKNYSLIIEQLLAEADTLVAHNAMFDRNVLRYNGFATSLDKWRDTMITAYCHGLVGSLSSLCDIVGVKAEHAKDKDGRRLVLQFCKPQGKHRTIKRATADTHPKDWAKFVEYARLDVEAMRAIDKAMPSWNMKTEQRHWLLDQRINDRGFAVDIELVNSAMTTIKAEKKRLAKVVQDRTNEDVQSATQRDAMLQHILQVYGIDLPDLQKSTLERRLADDSISEAVKELLRIRLQASTTSTSKYQALQRSVNDDGRLRGTLQFSGAARTGRWAGRTFQPQNLPRPSLKQSDIDDGITALKLGGAELLTDNLMELTSSAIRGCIIAPNGKKLVVSDLSNIEGRVQAWLTNETWKLAVFRDFDSGQGHDLYKLAYAKSFGISPTAVTKEQRQIGKVQELALGYAGGVGAFKNMALAYGIDLTQMADDAWDTLPQHTKEKALSTMIFVQEQGQTIELAKKTWLTCDSFKVMWREAHPNISSLWKELEGAAISAFHQPKQTFHAHKLAVRRDGKWLRIRLPSGRYLCYPNIGLKDGKIVYKGVNQYSRKWDYLDTYGGKLFENICQALARDILAYNMHAIEQAGYDIVLTVHDEVICEAPDTDEFTPKHLSSLLATNPPWADGLPLAAGGFEAYRYRKD